MKLPKNLGMVLVGIWLIVTGLLSVVSIPIPAIGTILAVLAIAAGVLILLGRWLFDVTSCHRVGAERERPAAHPPNTFEALLCRRKVQPARRTCG